METTNVTLSLPRSLLRRAKIAAAERGTSVSALVREALEEIVGRDRRYASARNRALARLRTGYALGIGDRPNWTRDELHER